MALSNIFREPRREITESVIGGAIFAIPVVADYYFAVWFSTSPVSGHSTFRWSVGMLVGLAAMAAIILAGTGILIGTHALGNAVCNAFERRNIHLRPRRRYGRET